MGCQDAYFHRTVQKISQAHCKKIRRFYGKVHGIWLPALLPLFLRAFTCITGDGRVVRWCWVNFQCRGVLQFGYSRARAYCARSRCGWGCLDIFTLLYPFSPLSPSLWETTGYGLKYCLKGPLNPKQPTNLYNIVRNQDMVGLC